MTLGEFRAGTQHLPDSTVLVFHSPDDAYPYYRIYSVKPRYVRNIIGRAYRDAVNNEPRTDAVEIVCC